MAQADAQEVEVVVAIYQEQMLAVRGRLADAFGEDTLKVAAALVLLCEHASGDALAGSILLKNARDVLDVLVRNFPGWKHRPHTAILSAFDVFRHTTGNAAVDGVLWGLDRGASAGRGTLYGLSRSDEKGA